jgi:hypothetical protein
MTAEAAFCSPPVSDAVERARLFSVRTMTSWALADFEEPVTAIITELVANAVLHARTDLELRLVRSDDRVRIEVADLSPAPPVLTEPLPLQEGGRGMVIIDLYADAWGSVPTPAGKIVWAELKVDAQELPWRPDLPGSG